MWYRSRSIPNNSVVFKSCLFTRYASALMGFQVFNHTASGVHLSLHAFDLLEFNFFLHHWWTVKRDTPKWNATSIIRPEIAIGYFWIFWFDWCKWIEDKLLYELFFLIKKKTFFSFTMICIRKSRLCVTSLTMDFSKTTETYWIVAPRDCLKWLAFK